MTPRTLTDHTGSFLSWHQALQSTIFLPSPLLGSVEETPQSPRGQVRQSGPVRNKSSQPERAECHAARAEAGSPPRPHTPSGTRRAQYPEPRPPCAGTRPTCPGATGRSSPPPPRPALTWPVMPVMSATFLGLPISLSPEIREIGQLAGA